ncbi:oligoendopeptidase F [Listeria sp. PSOL-1]|uniref:oligoendopeptidase F n=1 Tax=Listeria sp. PSOL-1 TaxID=1844999 RepID=UPI0013D588E4|nr:oligoendopeptidase F [Listeria sp. PSOL-1]
MPKDKNELPLREYVAVSLTWDLETIFSSDKKWEEAFQNVEELNKQSESYKGTLKNSATNLLQALQFRDRLFNQLENVYVYAHLKMDQDTTNAKYQGFYGRASSLIAKVNSSLAFFDPEILAIDEPILDSFLTESDELKKYRHLLNELNLNRPYILSEKEEKILASASEVLGSSAKTFNTLNNADIAFPTIKDETGKDIKITHGRYGKLIESENRDVREAAFKGIYSVYGGLKNTLASTLNGQIKKANFYARTRGYQSARESALSNNHIPETVYDTLLKTVKAHLPLFHRYIKLRKDLLNLKELRMYDLYAPLLSDVKLEFTYDEAKKVVLEGLKPLGEEYQSILEKAFNSRWIDVVENKGKRSGAYSSGAYGTNPYILLNWQDNINNVFTLAHELGHSVHSYYTRKNQPYVYGDYSIFLAEIASTTNENLLMDYLLKKYNHDKTIKAYLLNYYLDGFKGTVFRQTQFADFEHAIHQADQNGEALTAEFLTDLYFKINEKYYGKAMTYDQEIGYEWSRIPHFYMNYYVFQYATGYSAAAALSTKIIEEGASAVTGYLTFLKSGSSDYPIEIMKRTGVDMTTSKFIEDALKVFEKRLDELEQLV